MSHARMQWSIGEKSIGTWRHLANVDSWDDALGISAWPITMYHYQSKH